MCFFASSIRKFNDFFLLFTIKFVFFFFFLRFCTSLVMQDLVSLGVILSIVSIIGSIQCQDRAFSNNSSRANSSLLNRILGGKRGRRNRIGRFPLTPSEDLPVHLVEKEDRSLDPTEADLDSHKLRAILNSGYNPMLMSVTRPPEAEDNPRGILSFEMRRGRPTGMRPKFLDTFGQLNINDINGHRMSEMDLKLKKGLRRKITKFLWTYSHCPVVYKWKDLGPRFWPRWIREGDCHHKGRSCSFPPGMKCKPSKSKSVNILRFYCPQKGKPCRWIKIFYPIITRCHCSC